MFPNDTNIFIVDDMLTMRKLVKKSLAASGFTRVTDAEDGKMAMEKILLAQSSNDPYKLIISDWNMPIMTGIELLKSVRGNASLKGTPFILLTAESEKAQIIEAAQFRVNAYIVKPFTGEQLNEKIKMVWNATQSLNATNKAAA